jgi:hypothetical protein
MLEVTIPFPYGLPISMQDHDMQRGKPLYLSPERYAALTYLVHVHPVPCFPDLMSSRIRLPQLVLLFIVVVLITDLH